MSRIYGKWLGWCRDASWNMELVHNGLADKIIAGIKINNLLHKCGGIMSTTPIKINDVLLKHIYWESARQQLRDLTFRKATVNRMQCWVAFIGFESDDWDWAWRFKATQWTLGREVHSQVRMRPARFGCRTAVTLCCNMLWKSMAVNISTSGVIVCIFVPVPHPVHAIYYHYNWDYVDKKCMNQFQQKTLPRGPLFILLDFG